jgi:transcription elongation factor Elf1
MKMKDREAKIVLYCINCNKETTHTVYYIGNYLRRVVCDACKKSIEIDRRHLRTVFAEDFIDRILTKPHRMTEDMKKAFVTLTPFLPKRLFKEPLKVLKEIYEVLRKENGNGNNKDNVRVSK